MDQAEKQGIKVIIGCSINMFFIFGFIVLYSAAYVLLPEAYGVSLTVLSICTTAHSVSGFLFSMISTKVTQKLGLKGCLYLGVIIVFAYGILAIAVPNAIGLSLAFFIAGAIVGFSGYAMVSAIVSNWWVKNRTTMIAIPIAASTVGCSVYQYVGGLLFSKYDVRIVFFGVAMVSAAAGLITNLTLLRHVSPEETGLKAVGSDEAKITTVEVQNIKVKEDTKSMYKSPVFWLFMFGAFTDATSVSYITVYCTVFFTRYGMEYTTATTLLSGLALGSGLFGFINGRLMEKMGTRKYIVLIYLSAIIANISMILFQYTPSTFLIVLMVITYIIGYQCGSVGNLLTRVFCKSEHAYNGNTKYIGTMLAGGILFMPLFGAIVDNIGFTPMFVIITIGCFLSMIAYLLAIKMVEKNGQI